VGILRDGYGVNLPLYSLEHACHPTGRKTLEGKPIRPLVEHEVGCAKRDHPVHQRAAADRRTLQENEREVVRRAHAAFGIKARRHVALMFRQLVAADEAAFLQQEHIAPELGEPRSRYRSAGAASDDDHIGGRVAAGGRRKTRRVWPVQLADRLPQASVGRGHVAGDRLVRVRRRRRSDGAFPRIYWLAQMQRSEIPNVLERLGARVVHGEHESTHTLIHCTGGGHWRRRPSTEQSVLSIGREAREGSGHSREEERRSTASEKCQRELEIAHAVRRRAREPHLHPSDDVDTCSGAVVGVRYDTPRDGFQHRPMPSR
jgi:hypothetical protein